MKFAYALNDTTGAFDIHAAGCRDLLARHQGHRKYERPRLIEALTPEGAEGVILGDDFDGERTLQAAGFQCRIFQCARS